MSQKGFSLILIILGVLAMLGIAGGAYYFGKSQSVKPETTSSPIPVATSQTPQPILNSQLTNKQTTILRNQLMGS